MPRAPRPPLLAVVATSCGLGLVAAAIDQGFTIPGAPGRWLLPTEAIPAFSMTALIGAGAVFALWLCFALAGRGQVRWLAAIAGFGATFVFLLSWQGLLDWTRPTMARWPHIVSAGMAGVAGAGAAYLVGRLIEAGGALGRWTLRAAAALPVVAFALAVWTWEAHRETVFRYGLPFSPILAACVLGVLLAAIWIFGSARASGAVLVVLFSLPVLASAYMASRWTEFYQQAPPSAERPHELKHVILITVDTLRSDALSVYSPREEADTPHFDALAADSVVFRNAYADSSWTLPSIASLLSGLPSLSHRVGRGDAPLPVEVTTMAEEFRDAGYYTGAVIQNPLLDPQSNLFQGFSEYALVEGLHSDWEPFGRQAVRKLLPRRFQDFGIEGVTRVAERWVRENHDRDFFLWIHYYDPHVPYNPPARFQPPKGGTDRVNDFFGIQNEVRSGLRLTTVERDRVRQLYLGETRYVDEQLGKVLDVLRELGIYEPAMIAVTSDHGEEFWEHGGYEHGHTAYDEVLRVPLLVKLPGMTAKGDVETAVSNRLLAATFLEAAGITPTDKCSIQPSLSPYWNGGETAGFDPGTAISSLYFEELHAIWLGARKFIRGVSGREELYDLDADPGETRSLIGVDKAGAAEARQMLNLLEQRYAAIYDCYKAADGEAPKRSPAEIEQLRGLGYIQ